MSRALVIGCAAAWLAVMGFAFDQAHAGSLGCGQSAAVDRTAFTVKPDATPLTLAEAALIELSGETIQLSQALQLQTRPSSPPPDFPLRVPSGQTYYVQMEGQRGFQRFAAGAALPGLDCIEIECPASFPAGTTCWRCVEQIAAPE